MDKVFFHWGNQKRFTIHYNSFTGPTTLAVWSSQEPEDGFSLVCPEQHAPGQFFEIHIFSCHYLYSGSTTSLNNSYNAFMPGEWALGARNWLRVFDQRLFLTLEKVRHRILAKLQLLQLLKSFCVID